MTDLEIGRALYRKHSAAYRARMRNSNLCINGQWHGPPEPGKTKCTACLVVHRASNKRRAS